MNKYRVHYKRVSPSGSGTNSSETVNADSESTAMTLAENRVQAKFPKDKVLVLRVDKL